MLRKFSLAIGSAFLMVASTFASLHTFEVGEQYQIRHQDFSYRQGTGGEFQIGSLTNPISANYFHTFCAETSEHLGGNTATYKVDSAGLTSVGGSGTLNLGAANLFWDYYQAISTRGWGYTPGTDFSLGGVTFNYSGSAAQRAASGEAVQRALWYMLGYTGYTGSLTGDALSLWTFYNDAASAESTNVRIFRIKLWDGSAWVNSQDQFGVIPEPASIAVWTLLAGGVAGLVVARRRRNK